METGESFEAFRQVLLDCYGLWSGRLDAELNVIDTNTEYPNLHPLLLLSHGRREWLRDYMQSESVPLVLGDFLGLVWSAVVSDTEPRELFVLGPVYSGEVSPRIVEQLIEPLGLSHENKWALIDCLGHVPHIPSNVFFQHTIMLHRYTNGSVVHVNDFIYHMPVESEEAEAVEHKSPHAPHLTEKVLLDMVRTGNLDYHQALANAGSASFGIRIKNSNPIRQAKYSVVAFITLCARAAIDGGLAPDCSYTLSDAYTQAVDSCKTVSEIAAVSHAMYDDYIRRVNRCRSQNGLSRSVQACMDYIDTHPTEELSIEELAARSGYTAYYFTRMFKKETGQTAKEYILSIRLKHAKLLLWNTNLSVCEICERLHFSSQSYFASLFQKANGVTPTEYRLKKQTV